MGSLEDQKFILSELKKYGGQNSWDYQADLRFAMNVGDKRAVDVLSEIMDPNISSVFGIVKAVHKLEIGHIKRRRLRALNNLKRRGLVISGWVGTGWGGTSDFGVNRTREYWLTSQGKIEAARINE